MKVVWLTGWSICSCLWQDLKANAHIYITPPLGKQLFISTHTYTIILKSVCTFRHKCTTITAKDDLNLYLLFVNLLLTRAGKFQTYRPLSDWWAFKDAITHSLLPLIHPQILHRNKSSSWRFLFSLFASTGHQKLTGC